MSMNTIQFDNEKTKSLTLKVVWCKQCGEEGHQKAQCPSVQSESDVVEEQQEETEGSFKCFRCDK